MRLSEFKGGDIAGLMVAMQEHPQLDLEVKHHFSHGTYTRELVLPADTLAVGKIHRHSTTNILLSGKITLVMDGVTEILTAPAVFISEAGQQKAVYAYEDTRILNVHPCDEGDTLEQLESKIIVPPEEFFGLELKEEKWLG